MILGPKRIDELPVIPVTGNEYMPLQIGNVTGTAQLAQIRDFSVRVGTTALRPATVARGTPYFDTTINKPIWKAVSGWVDATGASV